MSKRFSVHCKSERGHDVWRVWDGEEMSWCAEFSTADMPNAEEMARGYADSMNEFEDQK